MSYGGKKMIVRRVKMENSRVSDPWWADCPTCPINKGFYKTRTHEEALAWALGHLKEHSRPKTMIEGRRSIA